MKCFIAMAFGRPDTDTMYDSTMAPLVRKAAPDAGTIRLLRVDKSDSNEPIDSQIYKMMEESDFAIADLTYARPSVYYEAGYVRGHGKPVIFTCRRDHLDRHRQENDPHHILRVHFDTEHENIIPWQGPNDSTFQRRLLKRVRVVTKPLVADRRRAQAVLTERQRFQALSLDNRLAELSKVTENAFRRHKFRLVYPKGLTVSAFVPGTDSCHGVVAIVGEKFLKNALDTLLFLGTTVHRQPERRRRQPELAGLDVLLISERNTPTRRRTEVLRNFETPLDSSILSFAGAKRDKPWHFLSYHILDGIRCPTDLRDALAFHLTRIPAHAQ